MATRGAGSPFVLMSCSTTRLTDTLTWMGVVPHATNGRVDDYEQCLMRSSTYLPQYAQVHLPRWCRNVHLLYMYSSRRCGIESPVSANSRDCYPESRFFTDVCPGRRRDIQHTTFSCMSPPTIRSRCSEPVIIILSPLFPEYTQLCQCPFVKGDTPLWKVATETRGHWRGPVRVATRLRECRMAV